MRRLSLLFPTQRPLLTQVPMAALVPVAILAIKARVVLEIILQGVGAVLMLVTEVVLAAEVVPGVVEEAQEVSAAAAVMAADEEEAAAVVEEDSLATSEVAEEEAGVTMAIETMPRAAAGAEALCAEITSMTTGVEVAEVGVSKDAMVVVVDNVEAIDNRTTTTNAMTITWVVEVVAGEVEEVETSTASYTINSWRWPVPHTNCRRSILPRRNSPEDHVYTLGTYHQMSMKRSSPRSSKSTGRSARCS